MNKISKVLVAACTLAVATFSADAQVKYGPVVGVNLANQAGDIEDNAMKIGAHIGGVVSIGITDNISVEPGIQFSMKGVQSSEDSKFKINMNYIDIPINLRYAFGEGGTGFNIGVGPYVGILMSAKATDGDNDTDIKEFSNSTDFGLNVGIGYQLESGLGFGANYGLGFANVIKDPVNDEKVTNTNIQVSIRYMLGGD